MSKNIKIYYFLISIVGGIFATAMPLYYQELSYSSYQIGVLIAVPSAAMLLQPLWGVLVDKYNLARLMGILGIIVSALILALLFFVENFYGVIIIVALYSIIKAPVWSSIDNIIITYCMNHNINYGPLRVFSSIAWGASLIIFLPFALILGFKSFFIVNLFISIYIAYIINRLPNEIKLIKHHLDDDISFFNGLKSLFTNKQFIYITIYTLFFSTLFVSNLNYQAMYFEELGCSEAFIALAMFISISPELILLPFVERISNQHNPLHMLMVVSSVYILKYFAFAFITNIPALLVFSALHGIGMSFFIPVFIKLLKVSVPNTVSTTAITFNGFISAITGIITSIVIGIISGLWGIKYIFIVIAFCQVGGLITLVIFNQNVSRIKF